MGDQDKAIGTKDWAREESGHGPWPGPPRMGLVREGYSDIGMASPDDVTRSPGDVGWDRESRCEVSAAHGSPGAPISEESRWRHWESRCEASRREGGAPRSVPPRVGVLVLRYRRRSPDDVTGSPGDVPRTGSPAAPKEPRCEVSRREGVAPRRAWESRCSDVGGVPMTSPGVPMR